MRVFNRLILASIIGAAFYVSTSETRKENMPLPDNVAESRNAPKKHEKMDFNKLASLVKSFESCALKAYPDTSSGDSIPTIGWGHTGKDVHLELEISQAHADSLLNKDLRRAYNIVTRHVKTKLNSDQMVAVTSFVYNVGPGSKHKDGFAMTKDGDPSQFLQLLNKGRIDAAAEEMKKWCKAGTNELSGLKKRRHIESALLKND